MMKHNFILGDVLIHKYDGSRREFMGCGYLYEVGDINYLKFTKVKINSSYVKKSMYNLELYTDFFEEE